MSRYETLELPGMPKPKKSVWTPPTRHDFATHIEVLAFDQTVNNTGVVKIGNTPERGLYVDWTAMIQPNDNHLTSHERTYQQATEAERAIHDHIERFLHYRFMTGRVVAERPSMTGYRTESSLLTGYAIWKATSGKVTLVSNTHAKAVLLGPRPKGKTWAKADVKSAVERLVLRPEGTPWNEHVRDAIMLGLAHLFDLKKEKDSR